MHKRLHTFNNVSCIFFKNIFQHYHRNTSRHWRQYENLRKCSFPLLYICIYVPLYHKYIYYKWMFSGTNQGNPLCIFFMGSQPNILLPSMMMMLPKLICYGKARWYGTGDRLALRIASSTRRLPRNMDQGNH